MNDRYFEVPEAEPPAPEPRTAGFPQWWAWTVLGLGLLVCLLFVGAQYAFHLNRFPVAEFGNECCVADAPWRATITALETGWAAALFIATLIMLVLAGSSLWSLARAQTPIPLVVALPLLAAGLFAVFLRYPDSALPPMMRGGLSMVKERTGFDFERHLLLFLAGLFSTAGLLASAVAIELRTVAKGVTVERFRKARLRIRHALTLTTTWLIVGVIGVSLFHRMTATAVVRPPPEELEALGSAATILSGAFYSSLLAALFGPADLMLRHAATGLAEAKPEAETADLEVSVTASLLKILAMFGPLLAGVLSNVVELGGK